jgi:hypothetical protein
MGTEVAREHNNQQILPSMTDAMVCGIIWVIQIINGLQQDDAPARVNPDRPT